MREHLRNFRRHLARQVLPSSASKDMGHGSRFCFANHHLAVFHAQTLLVCALWSPIFWKAMKAPPRIDGTGKVPSI
jgi:hypothetical protein